MPTTLLAPLYAKCDRLEAESLRQWRAALLLPGAPGSAVWHAEWQRWSRLRGYLAHRITRGHNGPVLVAACKW